jgi:hypothetical protein
MLKEVNEKMNKFIIKSCFHLVNSVYADGKEVENECGDSLLNEKCVDREDCYMKQIASKLLAVVEDNLCSSCDGCGYDRGCADKICGTHAAHECLDLLKIEFIDE